MHARDVALLVAEAVRMHASQSGLTASFRSGLTSVVPPAWLGMFAPGELQTLISGAGPHLPH